MTNLEKYDRLFVKNLEIDEAEVKTAEYRRTENWDSMHHMELMSGIEETFGISMETLDVMDFSSYEKGKEVLARYGIEL